MFVVSAHCDTHQDVIGRTLLITSDGKKTCCSLDEFDHPVHHIDAPEPRVRQRNCECHFGDTVRIADMFRRERTNASFREGNHRQHSRLHDRRAPKQALLLAQVA